MNKRLLVVGCMTIMSVVYGQTAQQRQPSNSLATASAQRAVLDQFCVGCHNEKAKAAPLPKDGVPPQATVASLKLTLDNLDIEHVAEHAEVWEAVVRKLRAGMMPPAGMRRPEPAVYNGLIVWLENELDRNATTFAPPPGLHRMNRTEYANAIRDLLALEIDPGSYLPSDDSTRGFDNMAGTLGVSSTLVEAYVSAAGKISRLAIGEPTTPSLKVYRTPEDTSQDYHIEGLPFGTRGGMLVKHVFPSEGEYTITITPIFGDNMSPTGFGTVPCGRLEILLDSERIQLLDWQGGGRAPAANCGGRQVPPVNSGQSGLDLGRGGMRVTFTTKAGPHTLGVT